MKTQPSPANLDESKFQESKPLQNIKTIENSLQILKGKLSKMSRQENENTQEIQKVFYSAIPVLNNKMNRSLEFEKYQIKKKSMTNDSVLREMKEVNREKKMINEKEIERNRELISIMKINERNSIKELSKKNELFIQKMKNQRLQENKQKKALIRGNIENSRMKVQDFHFMKQQELKRQKEEDNKAIQKKAAKMLQQLGRLNEKQNQTQERVEKTSDVLRDLRLAINHVDKMNETDFLKLKAKVCGKGTLLNQEKVMEKILTEVIENRDFQKGSFHHSKSRWASKHQQQKRC